MADIQISMTSFAKFVVSPTAGRVTLVSELIVQRIRGYEPARDYYRGIRGAINASHNDGDDFSRLDREVDSQQLPHKKKNFKFIAKAYADGWRDKRATFFAVPPLIWQTGDVGIRISPEVGMNFRGANYAVKLWFNQPKPTKETLQVLNATMHLGRDATWNGNFVPGVWDIRRDEFHPLGPLPPRFDIGLQGDIASLKSYWDLLSA